MIGTCSKDCGEGEKITTSFECGITALNKFECKRHSNKENCIGHKCSSAPTCEDSGRNGSKTLKLDIDVIREFISITISKD